MLDDIGCDLDQSGLIESGDAGLEDHFGHSDPFDVQMDLMRFARAAGIERPRPA